MADPAALGTSASEHSTASSSVKANVPKFVESPEEVRGLLDQYDVFILDLDGVIWRGDQAVSGAPEALAYLKSLNKRLFFATNNSTASREQYVAKLDRLGFGCYEPECVYTSTTAVGLWLRNRQFKGKIYMLGGDALKAELQKIEDVELVDGYDHRDKYVTPNTMEKEEVDLSIDAVVMGFDPYFNYYKASYATAILKHRPNSFLLATNMDLLFPSATWTLPGSGCFVRVIETASDKKAIVAGKPSIEIMEEICRNCAVPRNRICMVGDNLATDIAFSKAGGVTSILVQTGVHNLTDCDQSMAIPDFVLPSIASLNLEGRNGSIT